MADENADRPTDVADATDDGLPARLARYRQLRTAIEQDLLPLATSVDGFDFVFQASLHGLQIRRGGYVVLEASDGPRLGQITDVATSTTATGGVAGVDVANVHLRMATGRGTVLTDTGGPFHDARVRPASPSEVGSWLAAGATGRAALRVGELLLAPGVPAMLDSGGFGRHTFMCGQSGSGKTYSLGLLLERLLADTRLRIVILDPNSDHVGLSEVRPGAPAGLVAGYEGVADEVAVWRDDPGSRHPLRLRFADLDHALQAAALGLDPIRDRDEYAVLVDLLRTRTAGQPLLTSVDQLLDAQTPGARALGLRALNLGLLDWSIWDPAGPSLVDELREPTTRCTVVDLGSLSTVQEQRLVAQATLSTLWATRSERVPCLLVIDEAHNVCPAEPTDPVTRLSTDQAVQIAAEGRKYGRYLLCATQRPHKVHENVVSQCDNLLLMRMNSEADVADLRRLFSFVPSGLMSGATTFRMGEALVAGRIVAQPAYVRMGERISREGGGDVPATWAEARDTRAAEPTDDAPRGGSARSGS